MKKEKIAKINKKIQNQILLIKEAGTEVCREDSRKIKIDDEFTMDEFGVYVEFTEDIIDARGRSTYRESYTNFNWEEFWSPKEYFVEKFKSQISGT